MVAGIVFALWNNVSSRNKENAQQPGQNPQAQVLYAKKAPQTNFVAGKSNQASSTVKTDKKLCLREFGILSGFAQGVLKEKNRYEFVPVIFRFGYDLKRFVDKKGKLNPDDLLQFELEPFVNGVISPDSNIEAGANFLFKYGHFITKKICPYIEAGAGIVYMTQHTREQSTQFNFISQAGAGVSYFVKKNVSVNAGYRVRHLSNASIKQPNKGINVDMVILGISWYF